MPPPKNLKPKELIGKRWLHLFEDDGPEGEAYLPDTEDFPLSRRPREGFELDEDGSARFYLPGADDRTTATPATWREEKGAIVLSVKAVKGRQPLELRIHNIKGGRLLIRR